MEKISLSKRVERLPPYLFAKLEKRKEEYKAAYSDLIDMGLGDPDFPTQPNIIEEMKRNLDDPNTHHYPSFKGEIALRTAISEWYRSCYGVTVDPETEVLVLIGSKEGIAHLPLALIDSSDIVLVPDPAYPAYLTSVLLADGVPFLLPLKQENGYLPDFGDVPEEILKRCKMMFLNYPNNPTSALATRDFFEKTIELAEKYHIVVCHDFAYSKIAFDNAEPISFMAIPGAKNCGVEFHSFSKNFAMTGWRVGYVVGNAEVIAALGKVKSCMDSGVFKAIQFACVEGLKGSEDTMHKMMTEYEKRRDLLAEGLKRIGWTFDIPQATYYLWVKIPERFAMSSIPFSEYLLERIGLIVTPGVGFGNGGEGFIRISLNLNQEQIREALSRLEKL